MLILVHAGSILLEKRQASGIWGGLWSLPEGPPEVMPEEQARRLGFSVADGHGLPPMLHAFSHYRLRILPHVLHVTQAHHGVDEPGRIWLPVGDMVDAALPTPVRRLLRLVAAQD
jgi:A/G-specific adenine glycosylase